MITELLFDEPEAEIEEAREEIAVIERLRDAQTIPDAEDVSRTRAQAMGIMTAVRTLVVNDQETYEQAMRWGKQCAAAVKAVEANPKLKEGLEGARKLHKWFTDLVSSLTKPYKEARRIVDEKSSAWWQQEQARVRAAAQRRQREAERAAEEERLRLAEKLEAAGNVAAAERVLDEPIIVAPVAVVEAPRVEGVSHRENWQARGVDLAATVKAVAEGRAPLELLTYDDRELTRRAKALKASFQAPGVRVYDAGTVAYRA